MQKLFVAACAAVLAVSAHANLIINGTRVVYPGDGKTVAVGLQNPDSRPALAQTWIEHAEPSDANIPFIVTPPLVRIEPKMEQSLRVRYTGEVLPTDRESLFYLNILDVPAKPKDAKSSNYLQFTFRNRLKFFFRPSSLPYPVVQAYDKVRWTLDHQTLTFDNPTPYYITYAGVALLQGETELHRTGDIDMVAPFSVQRITLKQAVPDATHIRWHVINDYGAAQGGTSVLKRQ